jgi:serine/threonine protein kinase
MALENLDCRHRIVETISKDEQEGVYIIDNLDARQLQVVNIFFDEDKGGQVCDQYIRSFIISNDLHYESDHFVALFKADADHCYIRQSYFPQITLSDVINDIDYSRPQLATLEYLRKIAMDVCRLVDQMHRHRKNIIHCGLRPECIYIDAIRSGKKIQLNSIYIGDFRYAIVGRSVTLPNDPPLISPEMINKEPITENTDIFHLGCLMYQVFSGRHPFPNASENYEAILEGKVDWRPFEHKRIAKLKPILEKSITAHLREDGYTNVVGLLADLDELHFAKPIPLIPIGIGAGVSVAALAWIALWGATSFSPSDFYLKPITELSNQETGIDEREVVRHYRELMEKKPDDWTAALILGRILEFQGDHDGARALYKTLLKSAPEAVKGQFEERMDLLP